MPGLGSTAIIVNTFIAILNELFNREFGRIYCDNSEPDKGGAVIGLDCSKLK